MFEINELHIRIITNVMFNYLDLYVYILEFESFHYKLIRLKPKLKFRKSVKFLKNPEVFSKSWKTLKVDYRTTKKESRHCAKLIPDSDCSNSWCAFS